MSRPMTPELLLRAYYSARLCLIWESADDIDAESHRLWVDCVKYAGELGVPFTRTDPALED